MTQHASSRSPLSDLHPFPRHLSHLDMINDTSSRAFSHQRLDHVLPHTDTSRYKRCHERYLHSPGAPWRIFPFPRSVFFLFLFWSRFCPELATSFSVQQHVHIGKGLVAYLCLALSSIGGGLLPSLLFGRERRKRGAPGDLIFAFTGIWLSRLAGVLASCADCELFGL